MGKVAENVNGYVYNWQEFRKLLIHLATEVKTKYDNHFPYNCGYYHADGSFSFDCLNMIKALLWNWQENRSVGYYCYKPGANGVEDVTENGLFALTYDQSTDFSFGAVAICELLIAPGNDHVGIFVGEFEDRNGNLCNVVECTTTWNERRVIGSWVDENGIRYGSQGGPQSYCWAKHGKLPQIDYEVKPEPQPEPKPQRVVEDGSWGRETTFNLQDVLGCQQMDGEVSRQPKGNRVFLPNVSETSWKFKGFPWYVGGSAVIKAWQTLLKNHGYYGGAIDGYCGQQTVIASQRYLYDLGYYDGAIDGSMGPATVVGMQRWINAQ